MGLILIIYAELIRHYSQKWEIEKDNRKWEDFDEYEDIRNDLGVIDGNVTAIPKKKNRKRNHPSHQKHRY